MSQINIPSITQSCNTLYYKEKQRISVKG